MEFNSKEDLFSYIADLEGRLNVLQETVDKANPVDENPEGSEDGSNDENQTTEEVAEKTDEEINEIDSWLQES